MPDEQKAEFKQPFDAVDANGSGTVDASELKALIPECIGEEPDDAAVAECLKQIDKTALAPSTSPSSSSW
jgi:Ca2+-binding EF-hand superfamily protein